MESKWSVEVDEFMVFKWCMRWGGGRGICGVTMRGSCDGIEHEAKRGSLANDL